jgi:signal transduction histidine kinase
MATSTNHSKNSDALSISIKPGRAGLIGVYLVVAAVILRTFVAEDVGTFLPGYLILESVFLVLYTLAWWRPLSLTWLTHVYLVIQSIVTLILLSFKPEFDFVIVLFIPLGYQAALFYTGRLRWVWTGIFVLLTGGSLIIFLGFLEGLSLAPTTMAGEFVVTAYIIVNQETEVAKARSQSLLNELSETNSRLKDYTSQVEELAAIREHNKLAATLRDTVGQIIFSISLTARSAQLLLEREPSRLPAEVSRLQSMTAEALSHLRLLISQLRPPQKL